MDAPLLAGRYRLGGLLGRGGMGDVRDGIDEALGRPVAVKLLRPELSARPDIRARFTSEGRLAARLSSRSVVAIYDVGEHDGQPFLVMERLSGRTFADQIDAGPVPPAVVREVALQVLDGLAAAHAVGVLHRDIKPSNILDAGGGHWKLSDFGVAKGDEVTDLSLTATGLVVGTAAYLSPERLSGLPADASSDLYALGVVLHEALLGSRSRPVGALVARRPPLEGVPADLRAVIERATSTDPSLRFGSAAAMAEALRAGHPTTRVAATTILPVVDRTAIAPIVPAAVPAAARRPVPPVGGRPFVPAEQPGAAVRRAGIVVLGLLAAAALVVAAVLAGRGSGSPSSTTSTTTAATTTTSTTTTSTTTTARPTTARPTTTSTTSTTVVRTTTTSTTPTTVATSTTAPATTAPATTPGGGAATSVPVP